MGAQVYEETRNESDIQEVLQVHKILKLKNREINTVNVIYSETLKMFINSHQFSPIYYKTINITL